MKNMKSRFILMSLAAAAMTMVSCVKDNIDNPVVSEVTLNAVTEGGQTKTALTGFADVVWSAGDQIAVYTGTAFKDFTLASGEGTASASFSGTLAAGETAVAAVYPAAAKGTDMSTVKYPAEYTYSEMGVNAPMVAEVAESVLEFKHVGGVVKFDVGNIPPAAAGFVFTANSKITGDFEVTSGAVATSGTTAESVKISFTAGSIKSATFMVPLPTGTYNGFSVKFVDASGAEIEGSAKVKNDYSFTITRAKLLAFPAFVDTTTPAKMTLWEGEKVCTSYDWFAGFPIPDFVEGDVLRITYKDVNYSGDPANPGYCIMLTKPDWSGKFLVNGSEYLPVSHENTSVAVNVTAELAAELNAAGGIIVQGHNLTITKVEYEGQATPETVLWTGSQNAGGFAWFNGNGELPITLTDGDVLCFYFDPIEGAEYTALNICNGWDGGAIKAKFNGSGTATYGQIVITQQIVESLTDTPRVSINNLVLKKITLKR